MAQHKADAPTNICLFNLVPTPLSQLPNRWVILRGGFKTKVNCMALHRNLATWQSKKKYICCHSNSVYLPFQDQSILRKIYLNIFCQILKIKYTYSFLWKKYIFLACSGVLYQLCKKKIRVLKIPASQKKIGSPANSPSTFLNYLPWPF